MLIFNTNELKKYRTAKQILEDDILSKIASEVIKNKPNFKKLKKLKELL